MISKRIKERKDGKSSAVDALRYGEGLKVDLETGELLDKSHRTRLGNFGLVDDGVYSGRSVSDMSELIQLAALEMESNCDLNTRVGPDKKLAHFVVSFNQDRPNEAVLRDTEDSMLTAMKLDQNHFATFLHNDNGYWHLHLFASRIEKGKPHRGNPLWHDQINRDKVCRAVEARHGLQPDNGMHQVNEHGQIVEIPRAERQARREARPAEITDRAKISEIYSGEKSFQSWCNEIRLGDRLKHAKSWKDLHAAAAAYGCEVRPKGAGFVIFPTGEKGGLQLSKVGLKNLPAKFGAFQPATVGHQIQPETAYKPAPTQAKAASHYDRWRDARDAFKPAKTERINEQREAHKSTRKQVSAQQKAELAKIRAGTSGQERIAAVSIAKMQHTVALVALTDQFAHDRQELRKQLAGAGPGNTFRDYLVIEAAKGDNIALGVARRYGVEGSTDVLRGREAGQLKIVAAVRGQEYRPAPRLSFTHHIERNGTVVYDFGHGRKVTDSAISKQVQLNDAAARSPEAIATALTFATTKFGNTLTLTGSAEFQRMAVETAVLKRLGIKFADPALEAYREKFAEEQESTRERNYVARTQQKPARRTVNNVPDLSHLTHAQLAKGVQHVLARALDHGRPPDHILRADANRRKIAAQGSRGLHELSAGGVDVERQNAGMLLQNAVHGRVGDQQAGQDQDLRRTGASEASSRRERDTATADSEAGDITIRTANNGIIRTTGTGERASEASKRSRLPVVDSPMPNQQAQRAVAPAAEVSALTEQDRILETRIKAAMEAGDAAAIEKCLNELGTPKRQAAQAAKAAKNEAERNPHIKRYDAIVALSEQGKKALEIRKGDKPKGVGL